MNISNRLFSEKLELVVESKKVREEQSRLQKDLQRLSAEQTRVAHSGLAFVLEAQLSETQRDEIREIVRGGGGGGEERSLESRELKRKLADKQEQLRMLQGT